MTGEMTLIIVARNGLSTFATFFDSKIKRLRKQVDATTDEAAKKKLNATIKKREKLVKVVRAADTGLGAYLLELEDE